MSNRISTIVGDVEVGLPPRQFTQADEQQLASAKQELMKNRWDFYTIDGDEHNTKLIVEFFQANRQLPVTIESVFKAVAARQSEFRSVTPAQAEYYKVASEDVAKATQLETWLATQGRPGTLVNSGEEVFENMSLLLTELRGRSVTSQTIHQAEGRINFRPGRRLHYIPLSRRVDPSQKQDDPGRKPGQFITDANKSGADYAREAAAARDRNTSEPESPAKIELRAKTEAESLRGNSHSQDAQLARMFVNKPGGEIDWPSTLNVRRQMQAHFSNRSIA